VTIRYAPGTLEQLDRYKSALQVRVDNDELTLEEAATLLLAKQNEIFRALDEPKRSVKAKCSDCGRVTSTIGAQTFRCPCSPLQERSVWDSRKEGV